MNDLISRQAAIEAVNELTKWYWETYHEKRPTTVGVIDKLMELPSAQPTLYGYNIEHLELIASVLQEEDLPPKRVAEVLNDVGAIVAIVRDMVEKTLRKAVEQQMI